MKEGEVAETNRGGRATGDGDELDDVFDEDLEEFDDAPGDTMRAERTKSERARVGSRPSARTRSKDGARRNPVERIIHFVREVVAELQKVIWPTRKELVTYATVVIVFVSVMMTIVSLFDVGFAKVMFWVFGGNAQ